MALLYLVAAVYLGYHGLRAAGEAWRIIRLARLGPFPEPLSRYREELARCAFRTLTAPAAVYLAWLASTGRL